MTTALTRLVARLLFLPSLIVSVGILVIGYSSVGGGFSAGVIASLGWLLQYLVFGVRQADEELPGEYAPFLAVLGLFMILGVGLVPALLGYPPVTHFPTPGEHVVQIGVLEMHTATIFDLGIMFLVFGFSISSIRLVAHIRSGENI
jgi:multisubunit Na+/H+ antiporter MnhB subunit